MPREFQDFSKEVSQGTSDIQQGLKGVSDAASDADSAHSRLSDAQSKSLGVSKKYTTALKKLNRELGFTGIISKNVARHLGSIGDSGKTIIDVSKGASGLGKRIKDVGKAAKDVGEETKKATKETKGFRDEVDEAAKVLDLLNDKMNQGKGEAKDFASGLGATNGALIGAGIGAVYLFQKLGELTNKFRDSAIDLAKFNIGLDNLEKQTIGALSGQFQEARDQLSLTKEEGSKFFKVLQEGANDGIISVTELTGAAQQLQDTFGGAQLDRLQEYVDLLKEIPSIEADLSISASLDDRAGAIFDLAQKGKISTLIDLQTAGLAGGVELEATSDQVELLNSQKKTEKTVEDVHDALLKYFPNWGPQFGAIANNTFKLLTAAGAGIATFGAVRIFLGRKQDKTTAAVKDVEDAIRGSSGKGQAARSKTGFGRYGGLSKYLKKTFGAGFKKGGGGLKGAIRGAKFAGTGVTRKLGMQMGLSTKTVKMFTSSVGGAAKGLAAIALPLTILGLAFKGIGFGLSKWGKTLEESGDELEAAAAKLSGGLAKATGTVALFAATGASIAAVFGGVTAPVGALIGAVVGLGVALVTETDQISAGLKDAGKAWQATARDIDGSEIRKWRGSLNVFGKSLDEWGGVLKRAAQVGLDGIKATKEVVQGTVEYAKESKVAKYALRSFIGSLTLGASEIYFQTLALGEAFEALRDPKYAKNLERADKMIELYSARLKIANQALEKFNKVALVTQKRQQASGLALQASLKELDRVSKTGAVSLADFQNEVAMLELSSLRELGGSTDSFADAIDRAANATTRRFQKLREELDETRNKIKNNADFDANERKSALLATRKIEIEAAKKFADGLSAILDNVRNSGAGRTAELKKEGTKAELSLLIDSEADRAKIAEKAAKLLAKGGEELRINLAEANNAAKTLPGLLKKKLEEELPKGIKGAAGAISKNLANKGTDLKAEDVEKGVGEVKKKTIADLRRSFDEISDNIDGFGNVIEKSSRNLRGYALSLLKSAEELGDSKKAIEAFDEEIQGFKKGHFFKGAKEEAIEITRLQKERAEMEKKRAQLVKKEAEFTSKYNTEAEKVINGEKEKKLLFTILTSQVENIRTGIADNIDKSKAVNEALGKWNKSTNEARIALEEQQKEQKKLNDVQSRLAELEQSSFDSTKFTNKVLEENNKNREKTIKAIDKFAGLIQLVGEIETGISKKAKRRLDIISSQKTILERTGDALQGVSDASGQQNAVFKEQLLDLELRTNLISQAEKELGKSKGAATTDEAIAALAKGEAKLQTEKAKLQASIAEVGSAIGDSAQAYQEAIDGAIKGISYQRIEEELNLSEVVSEFAIFGDNLAKDARTSTQLAIKASKERLDLEQEAVAEATKLAEARLKNEIKLAKLAAKARGEDPEKAGKITELEGKRIIAAKQQAGYAKAEVKAKQEVQKAAEREAQALTGALDARQSVIEAEIDFLQDVGGSFQNILDLQQASLDMERQKLGVAENELALAKAGGLTGEALARKEMDVMKARLGFQKKAIGIQKDAFEKLIGSAFGQIRGSVGARRQRTGFVSVAGVDKSRVVTASGMRKAAGEGGVKTIEQRRLERQMGGGKRGMTGLFGMSPKKMTAEQKMADGLQGTEKNTETTNNILGQMLSVMTSGGGGMSISAFQKAGESSMKTMEAKTKDIPASIKALRNTVRQPTVGGFSPNDPNLASRANVDADKKGVNQNMAEVVGGGFRGKSDEISSVSGSPFEAVKGPRGGGSASTDTPSLRITGTMEVHFDNQMFRNQVVNIVGEAINSPEVKTSLQNAGVLFGG